MLAPQLQSNRSQALFPIVLTGNQKGLKNQPVRGFPPYADTL